MPAPQDFSGFGFAVGSVFGQRVWAVDRLGRLNGVVHDGTPWRPGVNQAKCGGSSPRRSFMLGPASFNMTTLTRGDAPLPASVESTKAPEITEPTPRAEPSDGDHLAECVCGFYAYFDKQVNGYERQLRDLSVTGVVEGFGKTVLGDKGFRSEKARIVALTLPEPKKDKTPRLARWLYRINRDSPFDLNFGVGVTASILGVLSAVAYIALPLAGVISWRWAMPLLALGWASVYVIRCTSVAVKYTPSRQHMHRERLDLIRRNYPDVKFYTSKKEMYAAHPLTPPAIEALTPDSDEFWTRKA